MSTDTVEPVVAEAEVPVDGTVIDPIRVVWSRDEGRLIERTAKLFDRNSLVFNVACRKCGQPVAAMFNTASGNTQLHCDCTHRVIERTL
jgi:hypothetical protein